MSTNKKSECELLLENLYTVLNSFGGGMGLTEVEMQDLSFCEKRLVHLIKKNCQYKQATAKAMNSILG